MNQNPLPRGLLQIVDRIAHGSDVVLELAKTAVAVKAQNATHLTGDVIVVHVFRVRRAADPTPAALSQDDPPNFLIGNLVTPLEMVVARAAVILDFVLAPTNVMARQTIAAVSLAAALVQRKLL